MPKKSGTVSSLRIGSFSVFSFRKTYTIDFIYQSIQFINQFNMLEAKIFADQSEKNALIEFWQK